MKNSKLLRTILMVYHIQQVKQKFNPSAKGFENLLGFCVINQLKQMNESEKVVLNIGGMPVIYDVSKNISIMSKHTSRDWTCFKYILQYYRYKKVFWPLKNNPFEPSHEQIIRELNFFKIPYSLPIVNENQEVIERCEVDFVDEATKNLNLFIQMIHQVIFESRSNFKNQIELTFLQSQDNHNSVSHDSTTSTQVSGSKKYTVLPRIQRIQSLAFKFKENGFDILELFGDEISNYFIQRNINFEIITSHDPNLYRIIIQLPKFDIMNKTQIFENSIMKLPTPQWQAES
ncbi:2332_t:CDS:2 [Funneliformis geosporum]|uniref:4004_t:CDS:1 n=1 Tax=Funneliformis geosporum TaxID=1117311 RepID=A0A9W4SI51_9GLOM|nr:2332_t:CDS:2 [Funneliformis geosporum]CAI2170306.1 4004_t:CDS:2 [Funneliformis geosporum]